METTVYTLDGKEKGKVSLPGNFETKVSAALMHEVITAYQANQRAGTHSTKTRGEVSGGGRKPWKEKGTGNARSGSNRSPLWRKGGIIFGPKPHGYYQNISQQKRKLALFMALSEKAKSGDIIVVDQIAVNEPKTKEIATILKNLKLEGMNILVADGKIDPKFKMAGRNIPGLIMTEARNLNSYTIMWAQKVVFTAAALEQFNK
jgi:large subunit ribosomal protein L4